jgi:2-keto-3-deoxy-6-phosphogluconate aldolase
VTRDDMDDVDTALLAQVSAAQIIPVLRTNSVGEAVAAAGRCFDAGLTMVELNATTPGWPEALKRVRADHPSGWSASARWWTRRRP